MSEKAEALKASVIALRATSMRLTVSIWAAPCGIDTSGTLNGGEYHQSPVKHSLYIKTEQLG